jgi:hypothetical protein
MMFECRVPAVTTHPFSFAAVDNNDDKFVMYPPSAWKMRTNHRTRNPNLVTNAVSIVGPSISSDDEESTSHSFYEQDCTGDQFDVDFLPHDDRADYESDDDSFRNYNEGIDDQSDDDRFRNYVIEVDDQSYDGDDGDDGDDSFTIYFSRESTDHSDDDMFWNCNVGYHDDGVVDSDVVRNTCDDQEDDDVRDDDDDDDTRTKNTAASRVSLAATADGGGFVEEIEASPENISILDEVDNDDEKDIVKTIEIGMIAHQSQMFFESFAKVPFAEQVTLLWSVLHETSQDVHRSVLGRCQSDMNCAIPHSSLKSFGGLIQKSLSEEEIAEVNRMCSVHANSPIQRSIQSPHSRSLHPKESAHGRSRRIAPTLEQVRNVASRMGPTAEHGFATTHHEAKQTTAWSSVSHRRDSGMSRMKNVCDSRKYPSLFGGEKESEDIVLTCEEELHNDRLHRVKTPMRGLRMSAWAYLPTSIMGEFQPFKKSYEKTFWWGQTEQPRPQKDQNQLPYRRHEVVKRARGSDALGFEVVDLRDEEVMETKSGGNC